MRVIGVDDKRENERASLVHALKQWRDLSMDE